jgi:Fe-S-cluster containining protein
MRPLELNLEKIKLLAHQRESDNLKFRSFLKGQDGKKIDAIVHRLDKEIRDQIDCTQCGNCCIELRTSVDETEIERLSILKNCSKEVFENISIEKNNEGDKYLKDTPCIFLMDKSCTIYPDRPEDCISYPNTHKIGFTSRLFGVLQNYEICPIVFNLYEQLKDELNWRR